MDFLEDLNMKEKAFQEVKMPKRNRNKTESALSSEISKLLDVHLENTVVTKLNKKFHQQNRRMASVCIIRYSF